ncbi:uncharacterized protein LOC122268129 [Penaeus japonicus]|uniref:uncharacterized protein LOC122268129 n=1 Tax=Penaeus japonicus TaxID=27405 RepID=UPI001C713FAE|nr:uncharacterized protein LOC122268129 [Penaeus japonicus]
MNTALILLVAVVLSCLMAAQAASPFGVLAGIGALTSAAKKRRYHGAGHGRAHGHGYRAPPRKSRPRFRRSVVAAAALEEDDDLILSAVGQMDPSGCIPKILCLLQAKDESDRTLKENLLLDIFTSNTVNPTPSNAAFVYAKDVATKTRDSSVCRKVFPECPFDEEELREIVDLAWSCDCNSGGEE